AVAGGGLLELGESGLDLRGIAARPERPDALDLLALELRVDAEDRNRLVLVDLVVVDGDDDALLGLDLGLVAERRFRDLALEEVVADRGDHAAELVDPAEVVVRLLLEPVGQILEVVAAAERVDRPSDPGLVS